ncbi:MAG: hypothetical protein ACQEQF_03815 [Bacillota bacterium]
MIIKIKNSYKNVYNINVPQLYFKEIYTYLLKEKFKVLYINIKDSQVDIFLNNNIDKACLKENFKIKEKNLTLFEFEIENEKNYSKLFSLLLKKLNSRELFLLNTNNFNKIILIYK